MMRIENELISKRRTKYAFLNANELMLEETKDEKLKVGYCDVEATMKNLHKNITQLRVALKLWRTL